jgi:hypothetical protein
MQKISSYLYPNRVQLLVDLAGFIVEYKNVYQRNVKIYQGVDNVIEFDIKNADQKRIELVTDPVVTDIVMNVMDQAGNALPNSPYAVTPSTTIKGIAVVTIPSADLADIRHQHLKYSVTALNGESSITLYADSHFGALGTLELVGSAVPVTKPVRTYSEFAGEINLMGNVINHSPAIATKFYEAVPNTTMDFEMDLHNFMGTIYLEGTTDMTISVESFRDAPKIASRTYGRNDSQSSQPLIWNNIDITEYNYVRVSWVYPDVWQYGAQSTLPFGSVAKITVTP